MRAEAFSIHATSDSTYRDKNFPKYNNAVLNKAEKH